MLDLFPAGNKKPAALCTSKKSMIKNNSTKIDENVAVTAETQKGE